MTIAVHNDNLPAENDPANTLPPAGETAMSPLVQWAYEARQAAQIAESLARTSFVPASLRGKPADVTAAILAGQELGMQPMAALRSMDVIHGTPALRAHAMRGLIQSRGHSVQLVESSDTRCVMRGRRAGEHEWQSVEWTIERAAKLGLTGKDQWTKQPKTMLVARATGEICRLIASDVLHAMPYAAEEIDSIGEGVTVTRVTADEILNRGNSAPAAQPHGDPGEQNHGTHSGNQAPEQGEPRVTGAQLKKMGALMREAGLTDREAALAFVNEVLDRTADPVTSRNQLTVSEAGRVIDALERETSSPGDADGEPATYPEF